MGLEPKFFGFVFAKMLSMVIFWSSEGKGRQQTSGAEHQQPRPCSWFPEQSLSDLQAVISLSASPTVRRATSSSSCSEWSSVPGTPKSPREFWRVSELLLLPREQNLCQKRFSWNKRARESLLLSQSGLSLRVLPSLAPPVQLQSLSWGRSHTPTLLPIVQPPLGAPGAPRTNQVSENGVMVYFW